ncbi:hypothetical protein BJI67_09480 [Acidihalobacter aeolianus]|uniref:DUF4845 domain-containing protein n=1 Tax=Acidihalobacter aeolianus TaxID=2792603 RepID=A0A1D8K8I7_9GAMM|nr:DUF4845 domain-containing protein [Acidihalobacter aeolianus]AOV17264.1 hypothetical protein BJI67_09480 [Acidihalobacter aeolianus]
MQGRQGQKGASYASILILVALVGVLFVIGVRLFPVYMDYYNVRSIMNEVAHSPGIGSKNYLQVWNSINTRFDINNIDDVHRKDFKMNTVGNETTLTIDYQVKRHLLANIDGLMTFKYSVHYQHTGSGD